MGNIYVCLTVDWEGESLSSIKDLVRLRKLIGEDVPLTHFICPNYFLSDKNSTQVIGKIKSAIALHDEIGLHIHCFKDLIKHIPKVPFRTEKNYYNVPNWFEKNIVMKLFPSYQKPVSGRGVPLSVYTKDEISSIIVASKDLLSKNLNISQIKGFRAGGWIANDVVLDVVEELGFIYDSSAVPPTLFSQGYSRLNKGNEKDDFGDRNGVFTHYLRDLWGFDRISSGFCKNTDILQQNKGEAIQVSTQPYKHNKLIEIPNNCGLADFSSPDKTVIPLIKEQLQRLEQEPDISFVNVYGCHQEGNFSHKINLIDLLSELSKINSPLIKFITMEDVIKLGLVKE